MFHHTCTCTHAHVHVCTCHAVLKLRAGPVVFHTVATVLPLTTCWTAGRNVLHCCCPMMGDLRRTGGVECLGCWQPRELWFGSTGVPTDPLLAIPHACHALWLGELHAGHAWPPFLHVLQPFHTAPLHVTLPLLLDGQCHFLYLFTCVVSLW